MTPTQVAVTYAAAVAGAVILAAFLAGATVTAVVLPAWRALRRAT